MSKTVQVTFLLTHYLILITGDNTRFLIIAKHYLRTPTGNDVTLVLFEVDHHPGSLSAALATFGRHKVSLTSIESRPVLPGEQGHQQDGDYREQTFRFLVEIIGHVEDKNVKEVLKELRECGTNNVNIIGSFQRGKIVANSDNEPQFVL